MANRNVFRGIAAYLTEHARTAKGEFSLDGIVVTYPDHDHIDGISELLRIFPPTTDPEQEMIEPNLISMGHCL